MIKRIQTKLYLPKATSPLFFLPGPFPNLPHSPDTVTKFGPVKTAEKTSYLPVTDSFGQKTKVKKIGGYRAYCHFDKIVFEQFARRQVDSGRKTQTLHDVLGANPALALFSRFFPDSACDETGKKTLRPIRPSKTNQKKRLPHAVNVRPGAAFYSHHNISHLGLPTRRYLSTAGGGAQDCACALFERFI